MLSDRVGSTITLKFIRGLLKTWNHRQTEQRGWPKQWIISERRSKTCWSLEMSRMLYPVWKATHTHSGSIFFFHLRSRGVYCILMCPPAANLSDLPWKDVFTTLHTKEALPSHFLLQRLRGQNGQTCIDKQTCLPVLLSFFRFMMDIYAQYIHKVPHLSIIFLFNI